MTSSFDRRAAPRPAPPPQGPGAKTTSPYSRFIPREELNSFAAWSPDALTGGEEAVSPLQRAQPPAPPAPPVPSPEELLAEHVRTARSAGYQDGYRDGLTALEGFKQSYATQITAQVGAVTQSYAQQLESLQQDMARALAVTATQLARQMVRSELAQRPELVVAVAQEAVDTLLLSAKHITLRVNPDDHPLVAQGAAEVLAARGARLLSDPAITRGGCVVESDIGAIDASIETRWGRTAAALGCEQDWNGVTVDPEADEAAE
jgi:flagellar assembly protein FliH